MLAKPKKKKKKTRVLGIDALKKFTKITGKHPPCCLF